jgi:TPP-dependent pyruvate/acetoin dehydrogenase alpha subunit
MPKLVKSKVKFYQRVTLYVGWSSKAESMVAKALQKTDQAIEGEVLARLYRALLRIRRAEEAIVRAYPSDKIKSPVHLSIGQESVAVGVCEALAPEDVVFGSYRGHAMYLAKGGSLRAMLAELYGKIDGCARGKGGSMHLVDVARGVMGTSAVVATTIPNAVGYAYAIKYRRENRVAVSFLGDGATEEGVFAESLNFAALKRLPLLFVCENNRYAIHTHQSKRQATLDICARVRAHGIPAETIEGGDAFRILKSASEAVAAMRNGAGPRFIECMTSRWVEHVGPGEDFGLGFRSREEIEPWKQADQVERLGGMLPPKQRDDIEAEVKSEIEDAFEFAEQSPFPGADELYKHVYR